MSIRNRAFTMLEMIFVIIVIGILAVIAIPKFSMTRDDALITRAKSTVASIRSSISNEIQKRILRGDYTAISNLGGEINGYNKPIFDFFDGDENNSRVLEYPPTSCKDDKATGCWIRVDETSYKYIMPPAVGNSVTFKLENNRFECVD